MLLAVDPKIRAPVEQWVDSVLKDSNQQPGPLGPLEIARRLENYLQSSSEFRYTLDLSVSDPQADPVVDFLINRKAGHCEYFASALAIALRAKGIPTRLISGFKGGVLDAESDRLEIQELHAHAWLEAYIEDAPPDPLTGQIGPRWIPFDPTPSARDEQVVAQEAISDTLWSQLTTAWKTLWTSAIRMNQIDQQSLVYDPLQEAAGGVVEELRGLKSSGPGSSLRRLFKSPDRWFSVQGGVIAFVLLLVGSGLFWGLRRLVQWLRSGRRQFVQQGDRGAIVPFYRQLTQLLTQQGWTRSAEQTQREFAGLVQGRIAGEAEDTVAEIPARITEHFYAARFGNHPASDAVISEISQQIDQLTERFATGDHPLPEPVEPVSEPS